MSSRLLLLDPDPRAFGDLPERLGQRGHRIRIASDRQEAERLLGSEEFDLVLAESRNFSVAWLDEQAAGSPPPGRILFDTFGTAAVPIGAPNLYGVLARPVDPAEAERAVERALRELRLEAENLELRQAAGPRFELGRLVSDEPRMGELFGLVRKVAPSRASVLILGESGTGKTELARALHDASDRAEGPFVEVHCGALAEGLLESELFGHAAGAFTGADRAREGKFEAASGGTLFLDELATAPLDLQVKLLRVLEQGRLERVGEARTREVDVRVVCATNEDLEVLVARGKFREDLYFRIQVIVLEPPPLRERPGDVPRIAEHFLAELAGESGGPPRSLSPKALGLCLAYDWPGNVRELRNALERASILSSGPEIRPDHLPESLRLRTPLGRRESLPPAADPQVSKASGASEAAPGPGRPSPPAPEAHSESSLEIPGSLADQLREAERRILEHALAAAGGHRGRACELLQIGRSTLFDKLRKHGLGAAVSTRTESSGVPEGGSQS